MKILAFCYCIHVTNHSRLLNINNIDEPGYQTLLCQLATCLAYRILSCKTLVRLPQESSAAEFGALSATLSQESFCASFFWIVTLLQFHLPHSKHLSSSVCKCLAAPHIGSYHLPSFCPQHFPTCPDLHSNSAHSSYWDAPNCHGHHQTSSPRHHHLHLHRRVSLISFSMCCGQLLT